ncbi:MAG: 2-C-methyl-D-erythritol 4-phosphate cytidylyltransferase [Candidatus Cloacimonetes bacterium]|jgi:2-C-methyl-D-erythritol 4-phosphate cytidylyltransferase|nr:2-C-methyl-D-erythritol 4-phosphate cytidylyltransferase [Candidatus Cloacimonadota bacterium]MDY0366338.1 2-C-methyl-D-erythritol 4-phosphate cytidylyltransferase [Candidatus Syntrophosphaera sp.]
MEAMTTAIVTAAGSGSRMGGNVRKQWLRLGGIPILIHTLQKFFNSAYVDNIIVTAPEEELSYCEDLIRGYFEDALKPWLVVSGGIERQDSVFGALQNCPPETEFVFIHDAVRPFITEDLIGELLEIARRDKAVIPVARLKNTIKSIQGDHVEQTVPRHNLVQVFTPQVFSYKLILAAYERAYQEGYVSTDDSALVEHNGGRVRYKFCSDLNVKITDEVDLFFARQILENSLI